MDKGSEEGMVKTTVREMGQSCTTPSCIVSVKTGTDKNCNWAPF